MAIKRWLVGGGVVAALAVAAWLRLDREPASAVVVDLVQQFPQAERRTNLDPERAFGVAHVTIGGDTKPAIYARSSSRIIWRLRPPAGAWLSTYLAIDPSAWDQGGDGVLFRVGVSDGRDYDDLLSQHVDPHRVPGDRRWIPVTIDLSPYANRDVDLIFNTEASAPGETGTSDYDESIWGAPVIRLGR